MLPDVTVLTPQQVHAEQQAWAHTGNTLDFPVPVTCRAEERQQRLVLGLANALWALQQPRTFRLYASVQPGQDLRALLAAHPDGIALGGLAPYSQDRSFLHHEIQRVRDALPPHLPLHVYGPGHPLSVQTAFAAGATSVDSSSPQRTAVAGHAWDGTHWPSPSAAERFSLAQRNLDQLLPPRPARGPNQLLTWPTGTGKTWTARQRARAVLTQGLKVLLLVPTRALASEVAQTWAAALPEACVQAYTRDIAQPAHYRRSDVLILTTERLFLLLRQWERHHAWMAQVGLLIIDEFRLIADASRGATLDATSTLWCVLFPTVPLLAPTATCGNPDVIARWLAAEHDPGCPRIVLLT
ncbi:DEAD/DEAH box helicase [uncultured Deinococcus sp.]|uniref:DEAD/DEAH box helicase n=1 Tax=uncultured Deinococcus sp. TaxID=158789 RepID=UPI002590B8A4|nr:DEAD/DEAH box helicase [uncultured Deinococcus sp.]